MSVRIFGEILGAGKMWGKFKNFIEKCGKKMRDVKENSKSQIRKNYFVILDKRSVFISPESREYSFIFNLIPSGVIEFIGTPENDL